jgi:MoxR-like ATPase
MGQNNLLNNFKILNKPLPVGASGYLCTLNPFDKVQLPDGTTVTADLDWFSKKNKIKDKIVLIPSFVEALASFFNGSGAVGIQKSKDGRINYLCTEVYNATLGKIVATVYSPNSGTIKQCCRTPKGKKIDGALNVDGIQSDGLEIWYTLIAALMYAHIIGGDFLTFCEDYSQEVQKAYANVNPLNLYDSPECIYKIQDSISWGISISDIPFTLPSNSAAPSSILVNNIRSGAYEPTTVLLGKFRVLVSEKETEIEIKKVSEIGDKYKIETELSGKEKTMIPDCSDKLVSEEALQILECVKNTPMKCFMLRGPAGTGKTTTVRVIANLLGLPYRPFTCSDGTDEMDIISKMIPNTSDKTEYLSLKDAQSIFDSLMMDPETALAEVTGEEGVKNGGEALQKIVNYLANEKLRSEKDFILVPSQIVEGVKRPSVVEIQEAALISKPGVLPTLNALLDDEEIVTLMDGTVIHKNPHTIFVFTTNGDYKGCKPFNESILSRMGLIIDQENMSEKEMINRLLSNETADYISKSGMLMKDAREMAKSMAKVCTKIKNFVMENALTGGVCGYREYANWFFSYLTTKDARKSAQVTIISHLTSDAETKVELAQLVNTIIPEAEEE